MKPPTVLTGPLAPITIPRCAQPVDKHVPDYEVELTIVIGAPARDVSEADALDYVLGYTGGNDVRPVLRAPVGVSCGGLRRRRCRSGSTR